MEQNQKDYSKKILLHACCAICSGYPISLLQDMGYSVVVYFYNPNIFPLEEYQKRLEAQKQLCHHFDCELIEGKYEPDKYYSYVQGLEQEPEKVKGAINALNFVFLKLRKSKIIRDQRIYNLNGNKPSQKL